MSNLTVVSVGEKTLGVVSARSTPSGVELVRAASAPLPDDFAKSEAGVRAATLKGALSACGGPNGRTALAIPRSMAILREFDLPKGSAEELLQMARFQIEKEMPLPMDQVRYSYVETPGPEGKVHVSMAAVPKDKLEPLMAVLAEAGCHVQSAYVSAFGLASLLPTDAKLEGGSALVGLADGALEVLVVEAGAVALSRSVPMREASPDGMATEVNRAMLSYGARGAGHEVKRVLVAGEGGDADEMVAALKERLGTSVDRLVLNGWITRQGDVKVGLDLAATAGVCVGALRGHVAMPNVLKTPAVVKTFKLKPAHRIAILASAILIALIAWSQMALSDRRNELDKLKAELKSLEPDAAAVRQMKERVKLVSLWDEARYPYVEVFEALRQKIDPKKLWLTTFALDDTGAMRVQGKAKSDNHVQEMVAALQSQKSKVFDKVEVEYTKATQDKSDYRVDFAVKLRVAGLTAPKRK
jgi:Tfp pilus assembly PilM family ATPase/Tfp pilus assembly protein PilN